MAEGEGGGKGGLVKIIIIVVVMLILFGVGAWGVMLFLGTKDDITVADAPPPPAELRESAAALENPQYLELGTFIVNLADGRRYLKTNLSLLISEEGAKVYLEKRLPQVKDVVVAQLQTLNSDQLREGLHRTKLRRDLLAQINTLLPEPKAMDWKDKDPVKKVLVIEFYLQ